MFVKIYLIIFLLKFGVFIIVNLIVVKTLGLMKEKVTVNVVIMIYMIMDTTLVMISLLLMDKNVGYCVMMITKKQVLMVYLVNVLMMLMLKPMMNVGTIVLKTLVKEDVTK